MDKAKRDLIKRYRKAIKLVDRENDIIDRARDRKYYWQKQSKIIKEKIQLADESELELPF
jgi:hypothetical protein